METSSCPVRGQISYVVESSLALHVIRFAITTVVLALRYNNL